MQFKSPHRFLDSVKCKHFILHSLQDGFFMVHPVSDRAWASVLSTLSCYLPNVLSSCPDTDSETSIVWEGLSMEARPGSRYCLFVEI